MWRAATLLVLALIVLQMMGVIHWSWWWLFAPLLIALSTLIYGLAWLLVTLVRRRP